MVLWLTFAASVVAIVAATVVVVVAGSLLACAASGDSRFSSELDQIADGPQPRSRVI